MKCQALLMAQGFSPTDFLWSEKGSAAYGLHNLLAGNAMTTSVVGAVITGLLMFILVQDSDGKYLD